MRELEDIFERAVILADEGGNLDVQHLFSGGERLTPPMFNLSAGGRLTRAAETTTPPSEAPSDGVDALIASLVDIGLRFDELEQHLLDHAMRRTRGNLSAAARLLGLRRGQFEYRAKKREAGSV